MDDSIFIDLVKALLTYEKDDKEKDLSRKCKESSKEKDDKEKKDIDIKTDIKGETIAAEIVEEKDATRFPSMQIFNVSSGIKILI